MTCLLRHLRHELDGRGAGADHRHPPAGEVMVVVPPRGVERRALEPLQPGQLRDARQVQRAQPGHNGLAAHHAPVSGADLPRGIGIVVLRAGQLGAEPDVRTEPVLVDAVLDVAQDLLLRRELAAPVGLGLEGVGVQVRPDVAGAAGISVLPPGAADPVRLLQDDEVALARPSSSVIAMPIPAKPVPTITTAYVRCAVRAGRGAGGDWQAHADLCPSSSQRYQCHSNTRYIPCILVSRRRVGWHGCG